MRCMFGIHRASPLFANILQLKSRKRNKPLNRVPPYGRAFFHTISLAAGVIGRAARGATP